MMYVTRQETKDFESELSENGFIVFPNVGSSMKPLIRQGLDLMVIEKRPETLKKYDVVLYKSNNQYILHRILKVLSNGRFSICGDNQSFPEIVSDNQIIGKLKSVIRNGGKEISVNDIGYKIYVHVWCDLFFLRSLLLRVRRYIKKRLP